MSYTDIQVKATVPKLPNQLSTKSPKMIHTIQDFSRPTSSKMNKRKILIFPKK